MRRTINIKESDLRDIVMDVINEAYGVPSIGRFKRLVTDYTNGAVQCANDFLKPLGLSLSVNWDYDFDFDGWRDTIGVYENGSVFEDNISIGMNIDALYQSVKREIGQWPDTVPETIIKESICTNVYHEMGHGLVDLISDYLQYSNDLDEIYDNNKQLFDTVLDNEEDSVEKFAWDFYDNQLESNDLYRVIQLYSEIL